MANIVPFPDPRLHRHAERLAQVVASYSQIGAERYVRAQVEKHRRALRGSGVQHHLAELQCSMLENAVWTALSRLSSHGGAA